MKIDKETPFNMDEKQTGASCKCWNCEQHRRVRKLDEIADPEERYKKLNAEYDLLYEGYEETCTSLEMELSWLKELCQKYLDCDDVDSAFGQNIAMQLRKVVGWDKEKTDG